MGGLEYLNWVLFLGLIVVGYFAGSRAEKLHFASIIEREKTFLNLPVSNGEELPEGRDVEAAWLVTGSAVIAVDYFKVFAGNLRNFFGGRMSAYESLLDRSRREATLRMKAEARLKDADLILNLRVEAANLAEGRGLPTVESLAFGTAIRYRK